MKIPLGAVLRRIVRPDSWLGRILGLTQGTSIKVGGHDILLSEDQRGGATAPRTGLDRPAKFEPPKFGGPRR